MEADWAMSDLQPFDFTDPTDVDLLMTMTWEALANGDNYVLLRWKHPQDTWQCDGLVVECTSKSVSLPADPIQLTTDSSATVAAVGVPTPATEPPESHVPGAAIEPSQEESVGQIGTQWPPPHDGCLPWSPGSSRANIALEVVSQIITAISIGILCAESMPSERDNADGAPEDTRFFVAEALCIGWFTVELLFRFTLSRSKATFFKHPLNLVDLATVVPFYVLLLARNTSTNGFAAIRVIRVARVLKAGKLGGRSSSAEDLLLAISCTGDQLLQFMVLFFCQAIVWTAVVFYVEKDEGSPEFVSIPVTLWWAYVTFTSVGYGDIVPTTTWGKVIVSFAALMGLILLTLPTSIFTDTFTGFFDRRRNVRRKTTADNRVRELHKVEYYLRTAQNALSASDT